MIDARVSESGSKRLEVLGYEACIELLSSRAVGRIAWLDRGRIVIVPVNYEWAHDALWFRTDPGDKLRAFLFSEISLQIDDIDMTSHTGWSVLARGVAKAVAEHDRVGVGAPAIDTWSPGTKPVLIRMEITSISGRRLVSNSSASSTGNEFWRLTASL